MEKSFQSFPLWKISRCTSPKFTTSTERACGILFVATVWLSHLCKLEIFIANFWLYNFRECYVLIPQMYALHCRKWLPFILAKFLKSGLFVFKMKFMFMRFYQQKSTPPWQQFSPPFHLYSSPWVQEDLSLRETIYYCYYKNENITKKPKKV